MNFTKMKKIIRMTILILVFFQFPAEAADYEVSGALINKWEVPRTAEDGVYGVTNHSIALYNENGEQLAVGTTDMHATFSLTYEGTSTSVDPGGPDEYRLGHSYPNPFNPKTTVLFRSPEANEVNISVYNILGEEIMHTRKNIRRGTHEIKINLGGECAQGVYFMRIKGDGFSETEKMTYLSRGIKDGNQGITVRSTGQNAAEDQTFGKQQTGTETKYRLVFAESDIFREKEIEIPANQDYDAGQVIISRKKSYWQGTISGEGVLTLDGLEEFESGFVMEVVNLPVFVYKDGEGIDHDIFNAWIRTEYMHPGWSSKGCEWTRHFTVETPLTAGEAGGVLNWNEDRLFDYGIYYRDEVFPTYSNWTCAEGVCTDPEINETSILGFGGVWGSGVSGFPLGRFGTQVDMVKDNDSITVSLPEEYRETPIEFSGDGENLTGTVQYNITGTLYRVSWEEHDLQEGEIIETDKHTRKEIDHEIEDPDGGDPMEQFELFLDAQAKIEVLAANQSQCKIEQFHGKLRMKTKDLTPEQAELKTPISVIGVRGTDYETQVDDDGTTTVTVFEGEVEFSDLDETETVTVGENQRSVVSPGELPTDPETIGERPPFSRWWEQY